MSLTRVLTNSVLPHFVFAHKVFIRVHKWVELGGEGEEN